MAGQLVDFDLRHFTSSAPAKNQINFHADACNFRRLSCPPPSPQACHIEGGSAGLIPSQLLEEKRKAFVKRDLELATSGTHPRSTQRSREAHLIMQI